MMTMQKNGSKTKANTIFFGLLQGYHLNRSIDSDIYLDQVRTRSQLCLLFVSFFDCYPSMLVGIMG